MRLCCLNLEMKRPSLETPTQGKENDFQSLGLICLIVCRWPNTREKYRDEHSTLQRYVVWFLCSQFEVTLCTWMHVPLSIIITSSFLYYYPGKPTLRELCSYVIVNAAKKWHSLGIQLGLPSELLDATEQNYSKDSQWCCEEIFKEWLVHPELDPS